MIQSSTGPALTGSPPGCRRYGSCQILHGKSRTSASTNRMWYHASFSANET